MIFFISIIAVVALIVLLFFPRYAQKFINIEIKEENIPGFNDNIGIIYKYNIGSYYKTINKLVELQETLISENSIPVTTIAIFYDNISLKYSDYLQSAFGIIYSSSVENVNDMVDPPIMNALNNNGYEKIRMPKMKKAIVCKLNSNFQSYFRWIYATKIIYPAVRNFIKKQQVINPMFIEVHKNNEVFLVIPLENEFEYKVPKYEMMLSEQEYYDSDSVESECFSDSTESLTDDGNNTEYEMNDLNFITNSITFKWIFKNDFYQKESELTYTLPNFEYIKGKTFNLSLYDYLIEFKLRSTDNDYINITSSYHPEPVITTAMSQNHFAESFSLFESIYNHFPNYKVIVYDLGLNNDSINKIKNICNVEYRKFNFDKYPPHVKQLFLYAWKSIIIAEVLRDFKAIWYADTSVIFKKSDLSKIYSLVTCRSNYESDHKLNKQRKNSKKLEDTLDDKKYNEAFLWKLNVEHCQKSSYLLHSFTGHGILPATNKGIFKYIPTNITLIGTNKNKMYEAGFIFAIKTKDTSTEILKWYLLCSLEKDCIAPPNSRLSPCNFRNNRYDIQSDGCHRYDQSVINVLLSNANNFDSQNYISELSNFFMIKRDNTKPWNNTLNC
uniref:Glycosyltransferase family 92 protein n=1 Tax=Strongyloides stercoralis TaxID=6248 RepID=A0A0K0E4I1_STRER